MASAAELSIFIRAKNEASSILKTIQKDADGLSDHLRSAAKVGFLGLAGGAAAGGAALLSFAKDAAAEQANIARLQTAIGNLDAAHRGSAQGVELVIAAREKMAFADDELRDSLSLLVVQTGDYEAALQRQTLAMDVSRGTGIDLQTSSKLLGKINEETINTFARYGIVLDKTATEQEALAEIQKRFSGQAAAYAETAAGKWGVFQIKLADIREDIGAALLPAITELGTELGDFLTAHEADIQRMAADFAEHIPQAVSLTRGAIETTAFAFKDVIEGSRDMADGLLEGAGATKNLRNELGLLGVTLAVLFPERAALAFLAGAIINLRVMREDSKNLSDAALDFQIAWLRASVAVGEALDDLNSKFTAPLRKLGDALGFVADKFGNGGLVRDAADALSGVRGLQGAEDTAQGRLDLAEAEKRARYGQSIKDNLTGALDAMHAAEQGATDGLKNGFIPSLGGPGGGGGGGVTAAAKAAQQGLIDMALAFADFHAATGLGEQDFMALIKMSEDRADMDKRAADVGLGLKVAQLEAADAGFQFQKALVGIAEDALKSGRTLTQEMAHIWEGIVGNIRSAFNGLFSRPTKEGAALDLEIALKDEELARRKAAGASSEETKGLEESIQSSRNRKDVLDKHANVLKAQIDVADQTLITETQREFAAKLYTIALGSASAQLDQANALVSLQSIAQVNYINALGNAAQALGAAQSAADPFNAAEKHWINGIAIGKGEPEPFPGFATGGRVTKTGIALVHANEIITPAGKAPATPNIYNITIHTWEQHGSVEAGVAAMSGMAF